MSDFYALSQLFTNLAKKYPHAPAISAPSRPDLTFQALFQVMETTHLQLRQLGIDRGDRVVLIAPAYSPETAILSLAIAASATLIPLDPNLGNIELKNRLQQLEPKAIVNSANYLLPAIICDEISTPILQVSCYLGQAVATFQLKGETPFAASLDDWAKPEDDALIVMTSGSTGRPKLVTMTQDALCYSCLESARDLQLTDRDICLNAVALFHVQGLITSFILPLLAGGKVAFYGGFDPDCFLDWLLDSQATWYSASPTIHLAILKAIADNHGKINNHNLRFIRSGSAPAPDRVITEFKNYLGVPFIQGYGMSEIPLFASTTLAVNQCQDLPQGYATISRDSELAIVDTSGAIVPNGTIGEIIARGRSVMKNYIDNPEANRATFQEDWFRTGDLGWRDERGYLYLAGRLKEIINRGGNKVSPQEVDRALMQFPEVEEVATFAIAHPRLGEDIVAAVVLKSGTKIAELTLRTLLFDRLLDFKVPSQILVVDKIPKGKTGKIQRHKLADEFADRLQFVYANPRNELETKIAKLFAQILNLDKIGIYDNFFLLGGDSLIGTQIISRICQNFAIDIPIRVLFELPTVADFAPFIGTCIDAIAQQPNLEYEEGQI